MKLYTICDTTHGLRTLSRQTWYREYGKYWEMEYSIVGLGLNEYDTYRITPALSFYINIKTLSMIICCCSVRTESLIKTLFKFLQETCWCCMLCFSYILNYINTGLFITYFYLSVHLRVCFDCYSLQNKHQEWSNSTEVLYIREKHRVCTK